MLARRRGMGTGQRVLVYLSRSHAHPRPARFEQSIVGHFGAIHEDGREVHCGKEAHQFLISDREFCGSSKVLLKRPPFCPIKLLSADQAASLPGEIRDRGVDVGVAVLLQSATGEVLLTRRARRLSIFPNVWVPPGGHVEPDEKLLEAGLRELQEETGLQLQAGEFSCQTLGLWESVYPPYLSRGLPRRHHVVLYLWLLSQERHQQLQGRLKPDEAEVSAYAWLEPRLLAAIAATGDEAGGGNSAGDAHLPPTLRITELKNGSAQSVQIPVATFFNTAPAQGDDLERVSTGTKFALQQWRNVSAARVE
nr:nucleoside diphosphate-linked moiety X motif 17 [Pogona vitticeps]